MTNPVMHPPHGPFRVLAVDEDAAHLEYLRDTLDSFGYQETESNADNRDSVLITSLLEKVSKTLSSATVTVCGDQAQALGLLHDRKDEFDIVIANIDKPYANNEYKFTNFVRKKMDLPVIVTCSEENMEVVFKAMMNGAWDFFRKPIRVEVLQFIWRYIIRNRYHSAEHCIQPVSWKTSSEETRNTIYSEETVEFDGRLVPAAEDQQVKGSSDSEQVQQVEEPLLMQKQQQQRQSNVVKWEKGESSCQKRIKLVVKAGFMDCSQTVSSSYGSNDPVVFGVRTNVEIQDG